MDHQTQQELLNISKQLEEVDYLRNKRFYKQELYFKFIKFMSVFLWMVAYFTIWEFVRADKISFAIIALLFTNILYLIKDDYDR